MKYMLCCGNAKDLPGLVRKQKIRELKKELEEIKKDFQVRTENLFKKTTCKN